MPSRDEHADAPDAEQEDDDQRRAEDGAGRGERRCRERQHRDRVNQAERDDRQPDRLQADANAAQTS